MQKKCLYPFVLVLIAVNFPVAASILMLDVDLKDRLHPVPLKMHLVITTFSFIVIKSLMLLKTTFGVPNLLYAWGAGLDTDFSV